MSRAAEVVLIGRASIGAEIAAHGLTLTSWRGEETRLPPGQPRFITDAAAAAGADLVLVTVKSGATEEAARALAAVLMLGSLVISFQNGVRNAGCLRELLPKQTVLAGMVPFNVVHRGAGGFHRGSEGELMVEEHGARAGHYGIRGADLPLARRRDMRRCNGASSSSTSTTRSTRFPACRSRRSWRNATTGAASRLLQREALAVLAAAKITARAGHAAAAALAAAAPRIPGCALHAAREPHARHRSFGAFLDL